MKEKKQKIIKDSQVLNRAMELLRIRGVEIHEIAEIVFDLQKTYIPDLTIDYCVENIHAVLQKREVQNAVITGIELDIAAENGAFSPLLTDMLMRDEGLYGIDEVLVLSIVNVYGSIGFTNFGYVDKLKPGIVGKLNDAKDENQCNTFIDDIVGAIAAAAASRIAHAQPALNGKEY